MAEELGSLAVRVSLDSSGFQSGVSGINKQMAVLNSEFKMNTSALGDNGKGYDGLKLKAENLTQVMELQKQKISTLETAYQKSVDTKGKDSKATQELEIKLNQAKTALNKMGTELNATNADLETAEKKTSIFSKAQEKLHLTAGELKEGFGAVGIAAGAYLKGAMDSAVNAQKSTAELSNLLQNQGISAQNAGKDIKDFTGAITKMSTFSGGEAKEALQALTEKGISAGEALKMEGTLANVAAGSNMSLTDAANLMADAYHGKTKALVSLGILSKEEVKNLGDSEKASISMADVQDRLNKRFSGAAQTDLNSYSGKMKQMQNQFGAIKTQIGTALLPTLTVLATQLSNILKPIADFAQANPKLMAAILSIVAVLGTLVGGASVLKTVTGLLGPMAGMIGGLGGVIGGLSLPIIAVVGAIGLAVFAGVELYKHWDVIKTKANELWTAITTIFNSIKNTIVGIWNSIGTTCTTVFTNISNFFTSIWNGIKTTTETVWNGIKTFFTVIWNGIVTSVMAIVQPFVLGITNIFEHMKEGLTNILNGLKIFFTSVWDAIKVVFLGAVLLILDLVTGNFTKLKEDANKIFERLKEDFSKIWDAIKLIFTGVLEAIVGFCKGAWDNLTNNITTAWDNIKNLTSKAWNGIKDIIINLATGIKDGAVNIFNALLAFFRELPGDLQTIGSNMFTSMKNGVTSTIGNVTSSIKTGISEAITWIKALPSEALQWGKDMMYGFANGIKSAMSSVTNSIASLADKIRANLHFSTPDEGPLKNYSNWMPDFMSGLASGIEANKYKVVSAIKGLTTDMSVNVKADSLSSVKNNSSNGNTGLTLKIENFVNNRQQDVESLATELAFYMKQKSTSTGGAY